MTLKERAERLAERIEGDCDICPCVKQCTELARTKHISPDCKKELKKLLKEATQ